MSRVLTIADRRRLGLAWLRWGACLALVMALHGSLLLTLRRSVPAFGAPVPEAIMIDLAPEPASPAAVPAPPDPPPPATEPEPQEPEPQPPDPPPPAPEPVPLPIPDAAPPLPQVEVPLPPPTPPKPRPVLRPRPAVARPPTERPVLEASQTPEAKPAPAPPPTGQAQASWESQLAAHLARFKRFPPAAQRRGEQGIVLMRLTMTHAGAVLGMIMVRSSGYQDLDEEAKAWMTRAQPLPAAPPDIIAQTLEIVVPLRFTLR